MTKVISVAGMAKLVTAGMLVVAGAAVNRLFRPFDAWQCAVHCRPKSAPR